MSVVELMDIWERKLGSTPSAAQFEIWACLHSPQVIKDAILATARGTLQ
jgi:hypothetical protein